MRGCGKTDKRERARARFPCFCGGERGWLEVVEMFRGGECEFVRNELFYLVD